MNHKHDLLFFGDFCPVEPQANSELEIGPALKKIMDQSSHISLNLECPLTDSNSTAIKKTGPHLKADPKAVELLQKLEVSSCNLANNHIKDFGVKGIEDSCQTLRDSGITFYGLNGYPEAEMLKIDCAGKSIALIGFTENEFSTDMAGEVAAMALEPRQQLHAIRLAKESCDYVIVQYHGGVEHYPYPIPQQQDYARFLIDLGADAVICNHTHVVSGYELYEEKPIYYGLGNFYFPEQGNQEDWFVGMAVALTIKDGIQVQPHLFRYNMQNGGIELLPQEECDRKLSASNAVISSPSALKQEWDKHCLKHSERTLKAVIRPDRHIRLLLKLGLLPNYLKQKASLALLNQIRCESHRQKILTTIKLIQEDVFAGWNS